MLGGVRALCCSGSCTKARLCRVDEFIDDDAEFIDIVDDFINIAADLIPA
ncbi:hypothetical protein ACG04R_16280 [Roseateles sp. BYS78W]|uniref:Uncharacterized protein n=1 Tax=Pelomonas candidula TaxID=3299025 RepID=A0ABW7HEJ7_9BURK